MKQRRKALISLPVLFPYKGRKSALNGPIVPVLTSLGIFRALFAIALSLPAMLSSPPMYQPLQPFSQTDPVSTVLLFAVFIKLAVLALLLLCIALWTLAQISPYLAAALLWLAACSLAGGLFYRWGWLSL